MNNFDEEALVVRWRDTKGEGDEHLLELVDEPFWIGEAEMVPAIRVETGEQGLYQARRLVPLTPAASWMLTE